MKLVAKSLACIGLAMIFSILLSGTAHARTRGTVVANTVNVRASAEITDDNRLFQVGRGQRVYIMAVVDDFYRVSVNDVDNVYIAREFVVVAETRGIIIDPMALVFDLPPGEGGQVIGHVYLDTVLDVTGRFNNWIAVSYMGGTGFVYGSYIQIPYFVNLPQARLSGQGIGYELVDLAMNYLGTRYLWGGTTPNGFDCSGFMVYLLGHFDIRVNRVSRDMAHNGVQVNRSDLQPGDLVFFAATPGGSRITHVGMYIGDGRFIHSSSERTGGVIISYMSSAFNNPRFVTARRVI